MNKKLVELESQLFIFPEKYRSSIMDLVEKAYFMGRESFIREVRDLFRIEDHINGEFNGGD